ncbi:4-hydroxythreonine-4-phosphate dehydrogenase PdxA [Candidatus Endowatersipora endosymbiont of Watersipora subatra]|uniref:4-hydroxythreonine-4-phosphate dehydrogenase PdxA n=1 Tax=Candidatus Endowatersipora endosymbiont of Watersipora subatra TaxID=3077946 RepID=UPI00312C8045
MLTNNLLPIAVSIGEPAGVGADVLLLACKKAHQGVIDPLPFFIVVADPEHLRERAKLLSINIPIIEVSLHEVSSHKAKNDYSVKVIPLGYSFEALPGKPNFSDNVGVIESIDKCITLAWEREVCGIVTLPINKKTLYDFGFCYSGHTEYLAHLARKWTEENKKLQAVMMLVNSKLRTVPVTIHLPLQLIIHHLNTQLIVEICTITTQSLITQFGISSPRLAISGLNPHAGENGLMGKEDRMIISPAVEALKLKGIKAFGPFPSDTMFHEEARRNYDVAICMYHDQAMIPVKTLAFHQTVNVTLGLPFIRTSPDHGTAFDLAGTGKANPLSFISALHMVASMKAQEDRVDKVDQI